MNKLKTIANFWVLHSAKKKIKEARRSKHPPDLFL